MDFTHEFPAQANHALQVPPIIAAKQLGLNITAEERQRASKRRDQIARQMWDDYQAELGRRDRL